MATQERRERLRIRLVGGSAQARRATREKLELLDDPSLEIREGDSLGMNYMGASNGAADDALLVLSSDGDEAAWLNSLEAIAASIQRPVLIALVSDRSPVSIRRIMRAGADELLFEPLDPTEAQRVLVKICEQQSPSERRSGGLIVSIISLVGGVGVTGLAGNLGLGLRRLTGKQVALLDLDLQTASLTGFLNLTADHGIIDLVEHESQLDSIQLEGALRKHPSGVYLLAAPERVEDSEMVTDQTVSTVLELMRKLFDFVVVDCGVRIDENAVAAWERSNRLLYLIDQSIAGTRAALRFNHLFSRLGLKNIEPAYVLGRYQPRHLITERQLAEALGKPVLARIPRDDKLFERMAMRGEALWDAGPSSAVAGSVEELCHRLASPGELDRSASAGLGRRLLGLFERLRPRAGGNSAEAAETNPAASE